jgi:phosphohistidine swiveling domain-containing protein
MARSSKRRQVVMAFDARPDLRTPRLRGGKGASLAEMRALGLPVPPGFTITTTVARAMMQNATLPKRFERQLAWGIEELERKTKKRFADRKNPLLLSVRSGAEHSMPGMMDTILNLGLNDEIVESMKEEMDESFVQDCWHRFSVALRSAADIDSVPRDPREQLKVAINAVINSWNSERAIAYRKANGIPEYLGTAVNVQAMVFGNRSEENSGTGVVFSRDPNTGLPGLYGEFLPGAQGEDVVSGVKTPMPISLMAKWNERVYDQLVRYVSILEAHFDAIVDVEFTVEEGVLWLLQCRPAKLSSEAKAAFAVDRVWKKQWTKEKALQALTPEEIDAMNTRPTFAPETVANANERIVAQGLAASPGAIVGDFAFTSEDAIARNANGQSVILVRQETDPKDLPGMLAAKAIVTAKGGATCHAAIVARQLGIPAVVGIGEHELRRLWEQSFLEPEFSVCGTTGTVYAGAMPIIAPTHRKEVNIFLKWEKTMKWPAPRIDFDAHKTIVQVQSAIADTYLLEAMAREAKGSKLEREILSHQRKFLIKTAEHFACYLVIAVASEARYLHSRHAGMLPEAQILKDKFGLDKSWERGDERAIGALETRSQQDQVEFFRLASRVFSARSVGWSNSIGGPKWATIADATPAFLTGAINHAVFVDHVFDLRHNNGPVFNKHKMVGTSREFIEALLDVKRDITGATGLFARFKQVAQGRKSRWGNFEIQDWAHFSLSREVLALWEKGVRANLWKETADV